MQSGYYRQPAIHGETVVFVCENDLWTVPAAGGVARRLTAMRGPALRPYLSPDGKQLAFSCRAEGHMEVYVMPAGGGDARRLTYLGSDSLVAGWRRDGSAIVFASNHGQPFARTLVLHAIDPRGGQPEALGWGPARSIDFGPRGRVVLGRHTEDLAWWKRYRGGRMGTLWIDRGGRGNWQPLIETGGNMAQPRCVGGRVVFVSDHEGVGNLYSCTPGGDDLRRHTDHDDYFVRFPASDGKRVVYQAGADLWLWDAQADQVRTIKVDLASPRVERSRKFAPAARHLESYDVHPEGHSLALVARGTPFTLAHWEGGVRQHGTSHGVRYRLARYLPDGARLALVSDEDGVERLELHAVSPPARIKRLDTLDIGRPDALAVAPHGDRLALTNHRQELIVVDLRRRRGKVVDRSPHQRLHGIAWSPDGRWLAYAISSTPRTSQIRLYDTRTRRTHDVTAPRFVDVAPSWDPEGRYLYLLSYREFDPVYSPMFFELSFPQGARPYLITLRADLASPFVPTPQAPAEAARAGKAGRGSSTDGEDEVAPVEIDLEGLGERIVAFPVKEGIYEQVVGMPGKVLFTRRPILGGRALDWRKAEPPARSTLEVYDLSKRERETLASQVTDVGLSFDGRTMVYRSGNRLRVLRAGAKPDKPREGTNPRAAGRKTGWLDLGRVRLEVEPPAEWRQMFVEAWRLQAEQFWTEDLSGVDWAAVRARYEPLLERVGTRAELSDLIWEMQAELGTSHAYEMPGDLPPVPGYRNGLLGADLACDPETGRVRIAAIPAGAPWRSEATSPLRRPGLGVAVGQTILAIDGRPVSRDCPPGELLVHRAGQEVELTLGDAAGKPLRTVTVKALRSETELRYVEWVEDNRRRVREATGGRAGYLHVPDMGPRGYAEFHRAWMAELECEGLVVDVRGNGGGHVSQLLIERLARQRLGWRINRWGQPFGWPGEAPGGPLVALTDENAGSDGDIFSHAWKLRGLGPLIGKRTWGGVVGIWPRHRLADGGMTTQPEFSTWFNDVGWGVENRGTEPDIEVEITPADHAAGRDPQLDRGISELLAQMDAAPPAQPDFGAKPDLRLPRLPPRR